MSDNRPFDFAQGRRPMTDHRPPHAAMPSVVGGQWSVVVIGYGNELRGDDAIGQLVAGAVAAWDLPGVRALAVHQLTPELAEDLAHADYAIFVDAYRAEAGAANIHLRLVDALPVQSLVWHTGEPHLLLALANAVYNRSPRAWWITVPAMGFDYGAELTCVAQSGLDDALEVIRDLIYTLEGQPCTRSA
jgi:hydrogenase maturation protease